MGDRPPINLDNPTGNDRHEHWIASGEDIGDPWRDRSSLTPEAERDLRRDIYRGGPVTPGDMLALLDTLDAARRATPSPGAGREGLDEHRPVLRTPTGNDWPQIECACGWLWNDDDPPGLPEGEDFMRHVAALGAGSTRGEPDQELRAALERYGRHESSCEWERRGDHNDPSFVAWVKDWSAAGQPCSCGLRAALADQP